MIGRSRDDDLLRRMADDLATIKVDMATIKGQVTASTATQQDHETRLRGLERWRYALPITALGTVASTVLGVLAYVHH